MSPLGSRRGPRSITCSYADRRTWRVAALNLVATAAKSRCELTENNVTKNYTLSAASEHLWKRKEKHKKTLICVSASGLLTFPATR